MDTDIQELLDTIESAIKGWDDYIPKAEQQFYNRVLDLVKQLDTKEGDIVVSVKNLRLLNRIKVQLKGELINNTYLKQISDFVAFFDKTDAIQNRYFGTIEKGYTAPELLKEISKQAIDDTIESLAGSGVDANVIQPVKDLLTVDVQSGSSWAKMVKDLESMIVSGKIEEARLKKYSSQIVTDAINQYSRQYAQTITADLGLKFYQYVGAMVEGTRPLCKALVNKRYIHESELPTIVKGIVNGKQTPLSKYKIPLGMIPGTTATNFQTYCGGYRCNHHLIPVDESAVPKYLIDKFKNANS